MFIDFEGIDGSGKTTLSNILAEKLKKLGYRVTHAREGGELKAPIARRLREMTRDASLLEMSARTEFLLNVARDAQQLEEVVRPALARGEVCITDRYLYSQLSHSGAGRGLPMSELQPVADFASQGVWPDLVILVDVDPELARLRKRVSKVGKDELDAGSRKGLVGAGLTVRIREAFLEMARLDPVRWLVIENNDQSLSVLADRIFETVRSRLEGRDPEIQYLPSTGSRWPKPTLQNLETAFFAAVDELELREPNLALYLLTGVPGLAAHQRRLRFVEQAPGLVARSLAGITDEESFELREVLATLAPQDVLASLGSDPSPRAMALRMALFAKAPKQAVQSLKRNDSKEAWALREDALEYGELDAVLAGLAGVNSERAWELRSLGLEKKAWAATAKSLCDLEGDRADGLRAELYSKDRLSVLKSTSGLDSPFARTIREQLFEKAPKVVLRTITGLDAPYAWRMRVQMAPWTKEALDSVDGMFAPEAWVLRERFCDQWPSTALSSLRGLCLTERGQELMERVLAANPKRVAVLKNAFATMAKAQEGAAKTDHAPPQHAQPYAEAAAS